MPNSYLETADLRVKPEPRGWLAPDSTPTIGDLHGNALKFLYFLVREGVVELTASQYDDLQTIYNTPVANLTKEQLETFKTLLNEARFHKPSAVILIGDELADRGQNDIFTLYIMQALKNKGIPLEICLSNHSVIALQRISEGLPSFQQTLGEGQENSIENLLTLIDKGLITVDEVQTLARECYFPALKLVNYKVNLDGSLNIYTHAPIGLETIEDLARFFEVNYSDINQKALIKTIDAINQKARTAIENSEFKRYFDIDDESFVDAAKSRNIALRKQQPVACLFWARNLRADFRDKPQGDFKVHLIHGHTGPTFLKEEAPNETLASYDDFKRYGKSGYFNLTRLLERQDIETLQKLERTLPTNLDTFLGKSEIDAKGVYYVYDASPAKELCQKYQLDRDSQAKLYQLIEYAKGNVDLPLKIEEIHAIKQNLARLISDEKDNAYIKKLTKLAESALFEKTTNLLIENTIQGQLDNLMRKRVLFLKANEPERAGAIGTFVTAFKSAFDKYLHSNKGDEAKAVFSEAIQEPLRVFKTSKIAEHRQFKGAWRSFIKSLCYLIPVIGWAAGIGLHNSGFFSKATNTLKQSQQLEQSTQEIANSQRGGTNLH